MNIIKKILFSLASFLALFSVSYAAYDFPYQYEFGWQNNNSSDTNYWNMIKEDVVNDDNNVFNRLIWLFHLSDQSWYIQGTWKAIYYIKWIINMVLWLVAFISLVLLIFAFFMIFFTKEDAGVTKAKQMIKWIALAIAITWLSWFIVSIFFRVERWTTSDLSYVDNLEISQQSGCKLS